MSLDGLLPAGCRARSAKGRHRQAVVERGKRTVEAAGGELDPVDAERWLAPSEVHAAHPHILALDIGLDHGIVPVALVDAPREVERGRKVGAARAGGDADLGAEPVRLHEEGYAVGERGRRERLAVAHEHRLGRAHPDGSGQRRAFELVLGEMLCLGAAAEGRNAQKGAERADEAAAIEEKAVRHAP